MPAKLIETPDEASRRSADRCTDVVVSAGSIAKMTLMLPSVHAWNSSYNFRQVRMYGEKDHPLTRWFRISSLISAGIVRSDGDEVAILGLWVASSSLRYWTLSSGDCKSVKVEERKHRQRS